MMQYPTPGEYQEAVQFPAAAFTDPQLQDAELEENVLGLPRAVTGAYAVVFPLQTRGAKWAVKCFLTDVRDQKDRYRAVSGHLSAVRLPYTAAFEYQTDGIRVDGKDFPLLKMEWIDGVSLNAFVARNLNHHEVLARLRRTWREMMEALEHAGIAHGDLQHGNVLVDADGRLRLVDYDTMFVPKLKGKRSLEVGHRNYQHPDRNEEDFGPHLDRFPALVVDTALGACMASPGLWEQYDTGENLLFRSDDFLDPSASSLFEQLARLDALRPQVEALKRACFLEPSDLPPFAEILTDAHAVPAARRRMRQPAGKGSLGAKERLDMVERWLLGVSSAVALGVVVLTVSGFLLSAAIVLIAAVLGVGTALWMRYSRRPEVRRLRRLNQEDLYFQRLLRGLRDELDRLERRRVDFSSTRAAKHAERLAQVQEEALNERLKHHFVGEARQFDGISHKVVVRLKASGIRTASHATPERIADVTRLSKESKARVNLWRSALASSYRHEVPTALSPAEERRLERYLDRQLAASKKEIERLRSKIRVQEEEHRKIVQQRRDLAVDGFGKYLRRLPKRR